MELIVILLKQIVIMFVLIAIGYYMCQKKFITVSGSGEIGKILLNLVIPIVIINSFWTERTPEKTASLSLCNRVCSCHGGCGYSFSIDFWKEKRHCVFFRSIF